MDTSALTTLKDILSDLLPFLGVVLGSFITLGATYLTEKQKIKKEDWEKQFETKMKMFQTLEFIEKKCEYYTMNYQDMGDYLNLEEFPTFHLIEIEKLSYIKFLIKCNYQNEYEKFLTIENKLRERREFIKGELFAIDNGYTLNGEERYRELSSEMYIELREIRKDITDIKEKI